MAILKIYKNKQLIKTSFTEEELKKDLAEIGVNFEIWNIDEEFDANSKLEDLEKIFSGKIKQVLKENNFSSYDIVSINPEMQGLDQLKEKFIPEHTHDDNEVRFFVDGEGLFCINHNDDIYQLLCQKGDYVSVPAHTKHWFDMGSRASFKCLRFFENKSGWIAKYTGSKISKEYPLLDDFNLQNITNAAS